MKMLSQKVGRHQQPCYKSCLNTHSIHREIPAGSMHTGLDLMMWCSAVSQTSFQEFNVAWLQAKKNIQTEIIWRTSTQCNFDYSISYLHPWKKNVLASPILSRSSHWNKDWHNYHSEMALYQVPTLSERYRKWFLCHIGFTTYFWHHFCSKI